MTAESESLILEILKRIQTDIADMKADIRELKTRVTIIEGHMAGMMASIGVVTEKVDRLEVRIERIERRLDLAEAH